MAKKILPLSISRVAANTVAIVELPINPTYEMVRFAVTGTGLTASQIGAIRVVANTEVIQEYLDLTQLIDLNTYDGMGTDTVNDFTIYFKNPAEFIDNAQKAMMALGTADLRTLSIEIQLLATPADIAFVIHAVTDTALQPLGVYNRIKQIPLNSAVSGVVEWANLARNPVRPNVYSRIHFFKSDINKVELEANGVKVIEATKSMLEATQKKARPVANVPITAKATHLDFCTAGEYSDAFPTVGLNDLRLKLTFGSAGNCQIVTEEIAVFTP